MTTEPATAADAAALKSTQVTTTPAEKAPERKVPAQKVAAKKVAAKKATPARTSTTPAVPAPPSKSPQQLEDDRKYMEALARKTLRKAPPAVIQGNRGEPFKSLTEDELIAGTKQFFRETEEQLRWYTEKLGIDVMWFHDWLRKYWAAWSGGIDEKAVREVLSPTVSYMDPLSFGRTMVGHQAFIDYNQAFFDAAPDLRYDALPGMAAINVTPSGELLFIARYVGCGHWDKPLRMYPFTPGSKAIPGSGAFTQLYPVDRYHFNSDGVMSHGETLWDAVGALQLIKALPSDESLVFKGMTAVGSVASTASRLRRRLPIIGEK